jgi:hypothetical protein
MKSKEEFLQIAELRTNRKKTNPNEIKSSLGFLSFSQAATPYPNAITTGEEGWWRPSLLPTSLSHQ